MLDVRIQICPVGSGAKIGMACGRKFQENISKETAQKEP